MLQLEEPHFVTLNFILASANTILLLFAGFLLRDAWRNVHDRMDNLEQRQVLTETQIAKMEGMMYGRRATDPS